MISRSRCMGVPLDLYTGPNKTPQSCRKVTAGGVRGMLWVARDGGWKQTQ